MADLIIFGGTTEGRLLAEYCAAYRLNAVVCVTSDYGSRMLPESPYLQVHTKSMELQEMAELIAAEKPELVLDATHPYAAVVTGHILKACEMSGVEYLRVSRKKTEISAKENEGSIIGVKNTEEAVQYLARTTGAILVTTGSKELEAYTRIPDFEKRIYARVLPDEKIMAQCRDLGIVGSHIIAMQGPFSKEMNIAMLNHTEAMYFVTKEAGTAGGFPEKIEAAMEAQVSLVVIGRPEKPEGLSPEETMELLNRRWGHDATEKKRLFLIGTGMGGSGQMTLEAVRQLQTCDVVLGAGRMLADIRDLVPEVPGIACYLKQDVMKWLAENTGYRQVAVVYSGDTGFYSGAKGLLEELQLSGDEFGYETEVYPGISTVSYLCAKLKTSWEDACLASAHGREADVCGLLKQHNKIFLLLGGENSVRDLCGRLAAGGYGDVTVSVGERLGYLEERVVTGRADAWAEERFDTLAAVLIRRERKADDHE